MKKPANKKAGRTDEMDAMMAITLMTSCGFETTQIRSVAFGPACHKTAKLTKMKYIKHVATS